MAAHERLKVLIVEDSEDDCGLLLYEMRRAGYTPEYVRVETAKDMRAALDQGRWDAIVSDYALPQFSGIDALKLLREKDSEIPFILVSGTIGEDIAVAAMKAGADDYLMKGELARFIPALERGLRDARARRESRLSQDRLKLADMVLRGTSEGIVITDAEAAIIEVNNAFSEVTGYSTQEVLGKNPRVLGSGLHDERFFRAMWLAIETSGRWEGEIWNARRNGEVFAAWLNITALKGERGGVSHYVGIINDITRIKESQKKLEYLANYDGLTDLPNRSFFYARLQHAIEAATRHRRRLAVLFIDLDNFKVINDSLGHDVGDTLLVQAAGRFKGCVRQEDTLARLGGDEFTVLLESVRDVREAGRTAQRLVEAMASPFRLSGREMYVSASIGISIYPSDGMDILTLMKNADTAMYKVKEQGRNGYQFFTDRMNVAAFERLFVETGLRSALTKNEFFLLYQPIEKVDGGEIVSTEALIRWRHGDLNEVPPGKFIPVAEETGLIVPIGEWVLRSVCAQLRTWNDAGLRAPRMALNFSARQFRRKHLHQMIRRAIDDFGVGGQCLSVELTESAIMEEPEEAVQVLGELKEMGIDISVDNFGTGYSSFSYLKRLPIDRLKIDRRFVQGVATDPGDAAITAAIIAMAHSLKLIVVAKGVETAEQFAFLKSHGCDEVQGYRDPLPAQALETLLQSTKIVACNRA